MLTRVSSRELTEWVAFLQIEHEEQRAEEERQRREGR